MEKLWKVFIIATFVNITILLFLQVLDESVNSDIVLTNEEEDFSEINQKMLDIEQKFTLFLHSSRISRNFDATYNTFFYLFIKNFNYNGFLKRTA